METAMCLIERSQDVYPLDIVRTMRDQRAMMIQTAVSSEAFIYFSIYLFIYFSNPFKEIQEVEFGFTNQQALYVHDLIRVYISSRFRLVRRC